MSKYTTGEMAKLCGVSVRTVQFYDTKGVLRPAQLSEGGRRLYDEDDLTKLRLICTLKVIGLSLDSIKGILESESSGKILSLLMKEQVKRLGDEIKERQGQLAAIKLIQENIQGMTAIPVNSIIDMEHMMGNKKGLKKVRRVVFGIGIPAAIVQAGTVVLWIMRGIWWPFVVWTLFELVLAVPIILYIHKKTAYICPECSKRFKPSFKEFVFSSGNKTRLLTCHHCGHKGFCVEVYDKGDEN